MSRYDQRRAGIDSVGLLLALILVVFVIQLFSAIWTSNLFATDYRNWSRTTWFVVNLLAVSILTAIRFGPDLYENWQQRRKRGAAERVKKKQHES
jgi:hypothetical protein